MIFDIRLGPFMKTILLSATLISNTPSLSWAVASHEVSVNQVMHTAFLMRKEQLLTKLNKKIQNKTFHRGTFFAGEITEFKGVSRNLEQFDFQLKDIPNGFALSAAQGEKKVTTHIEFVDPWAGIVRIDGVTVQFGKEGTYLQGAQVLAHILLRPFLVKAKTKKTGLYRFWPIQEVYADDSNVRYEYPEDLPRPYKRLWNRLIIDNFSHFATGFTLGGIAGGGAVILGTTGAMGKVAVADATASELAQAGALMGGVIGGTTGLIGVLDEGESSTAAGAGLFAGGLTGGAIAAAGLVGAKLAAALLSLAGAGMYLIDEFNLWRTKLDDLEEVGQSFNGILDFCEEGKENYYKQSSSGGPLVLNASFIAAIEKTKTMDRRKWNFRTREAQLKRWQAFQHLWSASKELSSSSLQGQAMHCAHLATAKGLYDLREEVGTESAIDVITSLCRTYIGVVKCFDSIPSPYGEKPATAKEAIDHGKRALKDSGVWEFYKSMRRGGERSLK